MTRFYVDDMYLSDATDILDDYYIPYDFDDGDRIMVDNSDAEFVRILWDEAGIDYDEI